jgi:hypothetical protein
MPQGKRPTPRQATRRAGRAAGSGVHPDVAGPVPPGPFRCPRSRDDGRGRFRQQDLGWDIRGTSEYGPSASPAPASPPIRTPRLGRGRWHGASSGRVRWTRAGHGRRDAVMTGASARFASPTRFGTAQQAGICPAWTPPKRDGYSAEPSCFHGLPGATSVTWPRVIWGRRHLSTTERTFRPASATPGGHPMVEWSSAESRAGATVSGHPGSRGDGITRAELSPYKWRVPHQGDGKPDSVGPIWGLLTLSAMTRTHVHTDAQSTQRLNSGGVVHAPRAANPASLSARQVGTRSRAGSPPARGEQTGG